MLMLHETDTSLQYLVYGRNVEDASNTGFSITMAVTFSSMILWWVREFNQLEVSGNRCVSRACVMPLG
jgi:hypothetical protein